MCVIIDTCKLDEFEKDVGDARHIRDRVREGWLEVVYSTHGRFRDEFHRKSRVLSLFAELWRNKKARQVGESELKEKMKELPSELRSDTTKNDDRHILALALASGARLLYTNDGPLSEDFTDSAVITKPKGKVYLSHKRHAHLLYPATLRKLCRVPPQTGSRSRS